ncbi:MAG: hypothetical protein LKM43_01395 [Wolbachia endosymbiont of Penenirmus auritus]|nr:hypothetical protein [Wolbachia endosymbiont of Penenirmus auritus]
MNGEFKVQEVRFCFSTAFDNSPGASFSDHFKQRLETQIEMARNLVGALKNLDKVEKIYSYMIKPSFYLFVPTLITAILTSGTLGTAFTAAATITGTCMLVGIATVTCLNVYMQNSCNSKIDNPNAEQLQAASQTV